MKKKMMACILAGCAVLCGCEQKTEETLPVLTVETTVEAAAETVGGIGPYMDEQTAQDAESYGSVLESYHKALTEGWTMAQYAEAGLSYMATYCPDKSSVFFAFYDLDGDGDRELLIGPAVNDEFLDRQIFEAYDLVDGKPRQLFCGFERIRHYLCMAEDGSCYFAREGSGGAAVSYWRYTRYEQGGVVFLDGVTFDADESPDAPWFRTGDMEGNLAEALDAETAERIIGEHDARKANVYRGFTCVYTFDALDGM